MLLKVGLLGGSVSESPSQYLHEMLFKILSEKLVTKFSGISYDRISLPNTMEVEKWLSSPEAQNYHGLNVTIPFKASILPFANQSLESAQRSEAANTLTFDKEFIIAANTDGIGFFLAASRSFVGGFTRSHVLLLGSGATARAIALQLAANAQPRSLTIAVRDISRALEMKSSLNDFKNIVPIQFVEFGSAIRTHSDEKYFLINATPLGGNGENPAPHFEWRANDVAADVVYNPVETPLLLQAKQSGATIMSGLSMLIEQAALSQMLWLTKKESTISPVNSEAFNSIYMELVSLLRTQHGRR